MVVEIWDDDGCCFVSGKGELVCIWYFLLILLGFWNDLDGIRFYDVYFVSFFGVWVYGDYVEEIVYGGLVIYGCFDVVFNFGGVCIGIVEIYCQVEKVEEVFEFIVIGQDWQGDVCVLLFVCLCDGV